MNDYGRGALEALAWVSRLLEEARSLKDVMTEVEAAKEDILKGVAVNFRDRLKIRV